MRAHDGIRITDRGNASREQWRSRSITRSDFLFFPVMSAAQAPLGYRRDSDNACRGDPSGAAECAGDGAGAGHDPDFGAQREAGLQRVSAEHQRVGGHCPSERRQVRHAGQSRSLHRQSDELLDGAQRQSSAVRRWPAILRHQEDQGRRQRRRGDARLRSDTRSRSR